MCSVLCERNVGSKEQVSGAGIVPNDVRVAQSAWWILLSLNTTLSHQRLSNILIATMSPKNDQRDHGKAKNQSNPQDKPFSDEDVRQESSKAAHASMNAQKKAKELEAAAAGAGDPDERQKLTEQAVNAQVEAESFGKTAKYMQSGAFQGMAVGTGLGIAPGATLGAVTGTLVGGVTSTITGGLGGGIGTAAGAIGGPMVVRAIV